ncbi:methyltransferase domain-containing protein [Rhodobacteraceae bacterium 2CG4]|uniref:Methyltransferase domain-containing protein n=1 Tax=Halovulum marinum TaxID=2662447 RepID=A0A6L5YW58_9RHOB|nr:methyltransferase domain-containing protein [Halovulum marinum]MSU88270.1 methyltransferase domain-containing protein [Halovulum marinum]
MNARDASDATSGATAGATSAATADAAAESRPPRRPRTAARMRRFRQLSARRWSGLQVLVLEDDDSGLAAAAARLGARAHWHGVAAASADRRDLLPFREASFELVLCPRLAAQPAPAERLLAEAARVLKHRGRLLYDAVAPPLLARARPPGCLPPAETREMLAAVGLTPGAVCGLSRWWPLPAGLRPVAYAGVAAADKPGIY